MTTNLIVCDAGPLIALGKINQLQLLRQLYAETYVPSIVLSECLVNEILPGAHAIKATLSKGYLVVKSSSMNVSLEREYSVLDAGEKEAILLAKELQASLLIDEKQGRSVAKALSLKIIGTAGLLLNGHRKGFIPNLEKCLDSLQKSGYRLSDRLIEEILSRSKEK